MNAFAGRQMTSRWVFLTCMQERCHSELTFHWGGSCKTPQLLRYRSNQGETWWN